MKGLLAVLLTALSLSVNADTWIMPNQGGGQVVLTDRKCDKHKTLNQAYTYTNKIYVSGCWALIDGRVHVVWDGNQRRVYEVSDFTPDEITPKKKGTAL